MQHPGIPAKRSTALATSVRCTSSFRTWPVWGAAAVWKPQKGSGPQRKTSISWWCERGFPIACRLAPHGNGKPSQRSSAACCSWRQLHESRGQRNGITGTSSRTSARSHWQNSWTPAHGAAGRGKEKYEASDRRTTRKTRLCPNTETIDKAMKGRVGGAVAGTAENRKFWTTALIPRRSGRGSHP